MITVWLLISVVGVGWNLVPVFGRYWEGRKVQAKFEAERLKIPQPDIIVPKDSDWPNATIEVSGLSVKKPRDLSIPMLDFASGRLLATSEHVFEIDTSKTPGSKKILVRSNGERLYRAALSGDQTVVATLGQYTQISFWNGQNGQLIQTLQDEYPTKALIKDQSSGHRHPNGLRYSNTDIRKVIAAPRGCLFAIGKVDGSVELWKGENRPLSDGSTELGIATPPQAFEMHQRTVVGGGGIEEMAFSEDCQHLFVATSWKFAGMKVRSRTTPEAPPMTSADLQTPDKYLTACLDVSSGEVVWEHELPEAPRAVAVDSSRMFPGQTRLAVISRNEAMIIGCEDGRELQRFPLGTENRRPASDARAVAFRDSNTLWTVATRHVGRPDMHSVTDVSAWNLEDGKLIVSAEFPGQVFTAAWDPLAARLAIHRYRGEVAQSKSAVSTFFSQPSSPFQLQVWDLKLNPGQHREL